MSLLNYLQHQQQNKTDYISNNIKICSIKKKLQETIQIPLGLIKKINEFYTTHKDLRDFVQCIVEYMICPALLSFLKIVLVIQGF